MKKLLTFFIIIGTLSSALSQQSNITRKCVDCTSIRRFYNGSTEPTSQASANIAIDSSTKVEVLNDGFLLKGKVICKNGGGNDAAWKVKITVLLPAEIEVVSYTKRNACLVWGRAGQSDLTIKSGYIVYELPSLGRQNADGTGDSFSFEIKTKKSVKASDKENFAIFVQSQMPDVTLCDNYWYWKETSYCDDASVIKR